MTTLFIFSGEFTVKELSAWVVVDLNTDQGRLMALDAVKYSVSKINFLKWVIEVFGLDS